MIRYIFIMLLLGTAGSVYSQKKHLELGLRAGNIHFAGASTLLDQVSLPVDITSSNNVRYFAGNLFINITDTTGSFMRFSVGHSNLTTSLDRSIVNTEIKENGQISSVNLDLALGKAYEFEKLNFRVFAELPIALTYKVYKFSDAIRYQTDGTFDYRLRETTNEPVLLSTGFNIGSSLYYQVFKKIYLGAEIKTGLMFTHTKGYYQTIIELLDENESVVQTYTESNQKDSNSLLATDINLEIGIRYIF